MRALACAALLVAFSGPVSAAGDPDEAYLWLQKIAAATHQLNYTGIFVYQRGTRVETSRITHLVDDSGEHAKLVAMDGSLRETYRVNDDVLCLLPDRKTALLDRTRAKKLFPAILPEQISSLKESYNAKLAGQGRVAGRDAQIVVLEPKDQFRYGHKFWADTRTGLLLRAAVWKDNDDMVDRFSFSDVSIGGAIDKAEVKPKLTGRKLVQSEPNEADGAIDPGWKVNSVPPGFKEISAMKRLLPGGRTPVNHIVFSDGLAAVSVFIEPASENAARGLSHRGALHVYTRTVADHDVKVLGEVPAVTVRQIADSVSYVRP
jgi:sigma-E factor negative regulatory protein RseB